MAETATVPVISPDGDLGTIPAEQLGEALKAGYTQPTPEAVKAEQFREEHDSPLKAAGLGALSGATLGLGNELLNKTGLSTPESQAAYREESPTAFGAGQFAGSIVPIAGAEALTGGAATAAIPEIEAAAGPISGAAERLAAGTVKSAAEVGSEAAAKAAAPLPGAGTLGHLAKDFGIGSVLSGGNQITEDALGDDSALSAEVLVPAMLGGGAVASAAGLGLRGAGKVLSPALRRVGDALGGAKGTLSDFLAQRAIKSGVEDGLDEASLKLATSDPLAATDPRTLAAEQAQQLARKQGLGKELTTKVRDLMDAMKDADKEFHADIRPEEANNLLANHDVEAVRSQAGEVLARNQVTLDQLSETEGVSNQTVNKAQALLTKAQKAVDNAEKPGDIFNAVNDYKRSQAKLAKYNKLAMGTDQEATLNGMRDLTGNVQEHLQDSNVYGGAADRQAQINAAESKFINARDQAMGDFGRTELVNGRKTRVLDEDRFTSFLGQVAKGKQQAKLAHLSTLLDAVDGLKTAYGDSLTNVPGKAMKLGPGDIKNLLDAAVEARNQGLDTAGLVAKNAPVGPATAYQAIGGRVGQPAQYDKGILGVGEAGLLMAGAHMVGVPAPLIGGAAMARAFLGGEALPAATTVKVLAMIAKAKNAFNSAADGAIGTMLKGGGRVRSMLPVVSEQLARGPQDFQLGNNSHAGLSDRESFQLHAQDIRSATAQPAALQPNNKLLEGAPTIGAQALAAHQRVLGALDAALPSGSGLSDHEQQANLFNAPEVTNQLERQDWVNAAGILHDPVSVMPLMQAGMLTQKSVATLKQAYPAVYGHLSQRLLAELTTMSPKDRAKLSPGLVDQMSTFLGVPLSSLQNPATIMLSQQTSQTSPQPQTPGGMAPKRIRKTAPMHFSTRAQTPNQAADAALAGH